MYSQKLFALLSYLLPCVQALSQQRVEQILHGDRNVAVVDIQPDGSLSRAEAGTTSSQRHTLAIKSSDTLTSQTNTYELVGPSWCRPDCYDKYPQNTASRVCNLNGFYKKGEILKEECQAKCDETVGCMGFASATKKITQKSYGCAIYTNDFQGSNVPAGWERHKHVHAKIGKTKMDNGGSAEIECYKVTPEPAVEEPACEDEFPDCPVYAAKGGWCDLYQVRCQHTCGFCPGGSGPPDNLPLTVPEGESKYCTPSKSEHMGDLDKCKDGCNCWAVDCNQATESLRTKAQEMCPKKCQMCNDAEEEEEDPSDAEAKDKCDKQKEKQIKNKISRLREKIDELKKELDECR